MLLVHIVNIHFSNIQKFFLVNPIVMWTYLYSPTLGRPQGRRSLWRWATLRANELPSTLSSSQLITLRVRCSWRREGQWEFCYFEKEVKAGEFLTGSNGHLYNVNSCCCTCGRLTRSHTCRFPLEWKAVMSQYCLSTFLSSAVRKWRMFSWRRSVLEKMSFSFFQEAYSS